MQFEMAKWFIKIGLEFMTENDRLQLLAEIAEQEAKITKINIEIDQTKRLYNLLTGLEIVLGAKLWAAIRKASFVY